MSQPNPGFREVEILRGGEGVAVVFTEKVSNGRISFALVREFEKDGSTRRTDFLYTRHIDAALELLPRARRRADELEDAARARLRAG